MFTYFAVPKTLLKQGVYGLWRIGEGSERPATAQVRKLQWGSGLGAGTLGMSVGGKCCLRGFGSRSRGLGKKDAKCITDEGFKQKTPQMKRRSVKVNGTEGESTRADAAAEVSRENCGGIHLIVGPMFAGKSTALLHRVQEEASRGRKVALVKSDKDTRYGLSSIVTHDGLQMPCYAVPDLATFKSKVGGNFYKELDVIGIDEAQFFIDLYEFCQSAADFEGKTLIVAGLDGDFLRRKFGSTLDLVPVADSIVKLSSRCEICGRPANFSFRKTLDTRTELVGGSEVYMPVCRQHFVNGQIVVETASTVIGDHQVSQMSKD